MLASMATTKAVKATATKSSRPGATAPRVRSALADAGDAAMRKLLLATLKRNNWNLTGAATELRMTGPSNVLHSIKRLGLSTEYEAAKAAGKVSPGNRTT